jgi:hypothetical protein
VSNGLQQRSILPKYTTSIIFGWFAYASLQACVWTQQFRWRPNYKKQCIFWLHCTQAKQQLFARNSTVKGA